MVMRHIRDNLLVQFSLVSFVIMLALAVGTSTILAARLGRNIELLIAHGAAMDAMMEHSMSGDAMVESADMQRPMSADSLRDEFIKDTDPFSIPSLTADVQSLRWNMYLVIAGGFLVLYLGLVSIVHRGWRTITRQAAGLLESQVQLEARVEERTIEITERKRAEKELAATNAQLEQALEGARENAEIANALSEAASVLNSSLNIDDVLDRILEAVGRVVPHDAADIMIVNDTEEAGEELRIVRGRGYKEQGSGASIFDLRLQLAEFPNLQKLMETGQPMTISDTQADASWNPFPETSWIRSWAAAPLWVEGEAIGMLNACSEEPGFFTQDHAETLSAFANQAAAAILNARLYSQAQDEIAERKLAEQQIQASLREKEVLLKEISHRVKNNLQLVSSLLRHQSKYIKDEQTLQIFRESQDRVRSMALVHEKLYQSKDLARIDFADYIRTLTSSLFLSYGASSEVIQLKIHAEDIFLGVDNAMPCALIINELVSNSLQHAFPDGGECEIRIELRSEEDQLELMVSDNGVGFPEDLDFRTTETLGLQLVSTLADQLEASIELDGSGGTEFKILICNIGRDA